MYVKEARETVALALKSPSVDLLRDLPLEEMGTFADLPGFQEAVQVRWVQ